MLCTNGEAANKPGEQQTLRDIGPLTAMATKEGDAAEKDATLARLADAETDLDLCKLSGDIDDILLDASLDEYQYVWLRSTYSFRTLT